MLFGTAIEGEKLARAVLASGSRTLDAVFISEDAAKQTAEAAALARSIRVERTVLPFTDIWPGEEIRFDRLGITAQWGLLLNRKGALWRNRGYSGGRDSISYEVADGPLHFVTAANNRFIVIDGKRYDNERNRTSTLHL